ncbi:MAG: site-specific integrase [Sphingomonas sp.]|uniref:tyrosine-type recombinase/integrase n=1 Tax=Sphingomonas sp. TaxID=28214 RepID=UPI0025EDDDD9|nr:site-specific integrase [Sphingomonas sp.]MBQ1498842.1 site-specific integrase [Sphingomonas sp.]MBQ8106671.1 site-specific integrase [Afipia sp.]
MTQPARVLEAADVRRLLRHVQSTRNPERNRVIVLLSFKAGLRACEVSGITWPMVLKANGRLSDQLTVAGRIAKNGSGRTIPRNADLHDALKALYRVDRRPIGGPIIRSERGGHMKPRSIVNWFAVVYAELGFEGCSSHSGRRTFITRSARAIPRIGGSLRDVQELAGHRSLMTTERYIQGDREAQRKLVRLI